MSESLEIKSLGGNKVQGINFEPESIQLLPKYIKKCAIPITIYVLK